MADGEVNVAVRAEGVEDATGEFDSDAAGADAGGDGGGGGMGQLTSDTGRILKVLGVIAAVVAIFEDVLGIVTILADIARAFIAPVAMILMRLFQPVLREFLQLLPMWMDFVDENEGLFEILLSAVVPLLLIIPTLASILRDNWETLKGIPSSIGEFIDDARDRIGDVVEKVKDLPSRIWSFMERLPELIGTAVADALPDLPGTGAADTARDAGRRFDEATDGRLSDARDTVVNIGGGLTPFVDEITKNGSFDFP